MPNQSCVSALEGDEGLVSWYFLPLSSTMGKLFVIVPWARSLDMLVIIIGKVVAKLSVQKYPGISRCRSQHVSVESSSLLHHSIYL